MSTFAWPLAHSREEAELLSMFSMSGPLPPVSADECPAHFQESEEVHKHYSTYRSANASADTRVCHAKVGADDVAGFIAFGITEEKLAETHHVYVAVRYVHIMQRFRYYDRSMLLHPVLEEVYSVLDRVKAQRKLQQVHIHHGCDPNPIGGAKFNNDLKLLLQAVTKQYRLTDLMD